MSMPATEQRRAKRIVVYCQHLSGAGHFVRCREIVRVGARSHHMWFMVGGPPVPGPNLDESIQLVALPAIHRTSSGVVPLDPRRSLDETFAQRRDMIERLVREVCPDVLIIEHFPFSKWLLRDELAAAIGVAREANPDVRVVCSVRDYPAGHEAKVGSNQFRNEVVPTLNQRFDQLLVHADPNVVTLETQFTWLPEIRIPIHYTGYVAERLAEQTVDASDRTDQSAPAIVVSSGGLRDGFRLAKLCVAAWKDLQRRGLLGGRIMEIFAGLFAEDTEYASLEESIRGGPFRLSRFSDDFLNVLSTADLSISQGGYNTTMNVLETRARAIIAPNPRTYDQVPRARRLAQWQIVDCIDPSTGSPARLSELIHEKLSRPKPEHQIALDGAEQTLRLLNEW